MTASTVREIQ
ncbi:hypothetical protein E2C01_099359 [Portunus trituberculatus]|uniref:Uncharacterized protein n=1 Tax=Portunus trituberculatus TaxID=210409 RepID=A0A5B7K9E8_PORTR|nr:hypothetical protein [Portunus trituberculatus]